MNLKRASEVGAVGHAVRRAMYRTLSLDRYLKTLSGMYLLGYRTGSLNETLHDDVETAENP